MLFRDLIVSNKDWSDSTELIIIDPSNHDSVIMQARPARSIFGDRQVSWFRDCVVMLL